MAVESMLQSLDLSTGAKILTDSSKAEFQKLLARWTDIDKKEPFAIVMPATEDDIVKAVKAAVDSSVPFVPKAGGHSSWATIGADGFILDLGLLRKVDVDTNKQTATASAGALVKDVLEAAWERGYVAVTGSVNTVGFIPSSIGGGLSVLSSVLGYGSDNILSARLVTAKGELITVSETSNPELLYAIKGAGQFFGVVTSLTVKIHPISILGNPEGLIWHATWFFDPSKAAEVAKAVISLKNTEGSYCLAGILPSPMTQEPVVMAVVAYLGREENAKSAFKAFRDIEPDVVAVDTEMPYVKLNEVYASFEEKGGYKKWYAPGLTDLEQFHPEDMLHYLEQKIKIDEQFPAAKHTNFVIEFTSPGPFDEVVPEKETAFSHRDVRAYAHMIAWASDEDSVKSAAAKVEEVVAHVRRTQPKQEYSFYQNFSREAPIEERYKGAERLEKLKALKRAWDAKGVFTRQLL